MFMRKVQPITARIPQMTTAGNHELWANFSECDMSRRVEGSDVSSPRVWV